MDEEGAEAFERRWKWLTDMKATTQVRDGAAYLSEAQLQLLGAKNGDSVKVVGMGNHLELWSPEHWESTVAEVDEFLELFEIEM